MPKGRTRAVGCACDACMGSVVVWEKLTRDGLGLIQCDCGQWVEHAGYWPHRLGHA